MWSRLFDLLLKIRSTGGELDIATIASICRSVPTVTMKDIDEPAPPSLRMTSPHPKRPSLSPNRRSKPIAALVKIAPNEANSRVQGDQFGTAGRA